MEIYTSRSQFATLRTIPHQHVTVQDGFWLGRQAINHHTSLKHAYRKLEESGNFNNIKLAAGKGSGAYCQPVFMDSDIYKWLEAVSYELASHPDPELAEMADTAIGILAAAQQADGYLNSYFQVEAPDKMWTELAMGHELYCAGHLFEAAVAHQRATGKSSLIDIACRFADHIDARFGPGKGDAVPGHPEVELALVELFRQTGTRRYLDLALFFIDQRGHGKMIGQTPFRSGYHQDRVPLREVEIVEGHAVRQLYLLAGVADVYLETGEQALLEVCQRLWRDLTTSKMYLTAGMGARHFGEAFGGAYELPNETCYCETCAAIANMMWNWRMLAITGEARYADLLERGLYNGFLSGISLDGQRYFYVNPLASAGGIERPEWYGCACCPPNIMRTIAMLGHYVATTSPNGLQIQQYIASQVAVDLENGGAVKLTLETRYPWDGKVRLVIVEGGEAPWELALRIPAWCREARVEVGGQVVNLSDLAGDYARFTRSWQAGEVITLEMALQPRFTAANPRVDATRGSLAIERGPLVYCFEGQDQPAVEDLSDFLINPAQPLSETWRPDLLGGIVTIQAVGALADIGPWEDRLYAAWCDAHPPQQEVVLNAVPYYAWANRTPGTMRVWMARA